MGPPQGEALLQGKSLICVVPFNGGCLFQAVSPSRSGLLAWVRPKDYSQQNTLMNNYTAKMSLVPDD